MSTDRAQRALTFRFLSLPAHDARIYGAFACAHEVARFRAGT